MVWQTGVGTTRRGKEFRNLHGWEMQGVSLFGIYMYDLGSLGLAVLVDEHTPS